MMENKKVVILSIDFGNDYSGYSYAFITGRGDNVDIYTHDTWSGPCHPNLSSTLLTTAVTNTVSLDKNGRLVKFGYDAREDHDNAIFSKYKMVLFNTESREKTMVQADNCDQTASVETLFTETLKFFKQSSLESLDLEYKSNYSCNRVKIERADQVIWVITVPDTSDDDVSIVRAIHQIAINAGLCTIDTIKESLFITTASKAGSLECIFEKTYAYQLAPDQSFLVFNIGVDTADFTAYRQLEDERMEPIISRFGGTFGSNNCNQYFKRFMLDLLGGDEMTQEIIDGTDFITLLETFDNIIKKSMSDVNAKSRNIPFNPKVFDKNIDWILQRIKQYNSRTGSKIQYKRTGHLSIPLDTILSFFQPIFQTIVNTVKEHMEKYEAIKNPTYIFMIGSFCENHLLQEFVRKEFASTGATIAIPYRPLMCASMGACRLAITKNNH
ncbi:hypothetical protein DFA_11444 [Cavenderia fasciculata]|uniref:Hsp70 family protein n=1 Tax=Cavenderia fasciculata TaxID=261658 RepID=F4QD02_CACFS|nr:uncharacterized protein DFA_11444 [Cavenderia fasciculata]EGG13683.1 hypothetical protein DFA_11444 [Cavenderia fasciculata]|eukprot:XP_004350387.1 hypothetical protein DFA_11444 [Cavenderia fasciculata]